MVVTEFNRTNLEHLRREMETNLTSLFEKYGLKVDVGSIRFGSTEFRTKLTVNVPGGDTREKDKQDFEEAAFALGVSNDAFGKTFRYRGDSYTVVGLKPRSFKFPVIGANITGSRYKFPLSVLDNVK